MVKTTLKTVPEIAGHINLLIGEIERSLEHMKHKPDDFGLAQGYQLEGQLEVLKALRDMIPRGYPNLGALTEQFQDDNDWHKMQMWVRRDKSVLYIDDIHEVK